MKGQCLCGSVKFEVEGDIPNLYQCHCSECRKTTGSSASTATIIHVKDFRWVSGKERISTFKKDSGYRSDFCSICGSPVPNPLGDTDMMWVPAGLVEETEGLSVAVHIYMNSSAKWEPKATYAAQFEESPGLKALIETLQQTSR